MRILISIILSLHLIPSILHSQCFPDRHNTSWSDAWISCTPSQNPNPNHGLSHWILYDLGEVYPLSKMHVWNLNIPGEELLGAKTVEIDYRVDDNNPNWQNLGTYELNKGPGTSTYEGEEVTDWEGMQARYILLTFLENYGGKCTGISEVKFELEKAEVITRNNPEVNPELSVQTYPNPFKNRFTLVVRSEREEPVRYEIMNVLGQNLLHGTLTIKGSEKIEINTSHLPAGNYYIFVEQGAAKISRSLVHIP